MPIYAYKCASCGHAKDMLQKISDAPLTVCPQCGQPSFHKQVTAAGFQLKGTGWYATDFRGGATAPGSSPDKDGKAESKPDQAKGGEAKGQSQNSGATSAPAAPSPSAPGGADSGSRSDN
jgi:putative FmdB family regulatory protein